jgi:hypothetical protein
MLFHKKYNQKLFIFFGDLKRAKKEGSKGPKRRVQKGQKGGFKSVKREGSKVSKGRVQKGQKGGFKREP